MHTVVAFWTKAFAKTNVYQAIAPVPDQAIPFNQSGQFILPVDMKICAGIVGGAGTTAARLNMPWLRSVLLPELYPANQSATMATNYPFFYYGDTGFVLKKTEGFSLEASGDGAADADAYGALWLDFGVRTPIGGPVYTMRATVNGSSGITTVDGTWQFGNLTFAQQLPAGTYAVVGMAVSDTGALAARLVFPGYGFLRPGCICDAAYGDTYAPQIFRQGRLGEWGRFVQTAQPGIELMGIAGGAENPNVFVDLVKVSDSMTPIASPYGNIVPNAMGY